MNFGDKPQQIFVFSKRKKQHSLATKIKLEYRKISTTVLVALREYSMSCNMIAA